MLITHTRVKKLAKQNHISIAKLQKVLGLGKSVIYDWKKEDVYPQSDSLLKVADYFNVTVDYLLGRTPFPNFETANTVSPIALRIIEGTKDLDFTEDDADYITEQIKLHHRFKHR